MHVQAWMLDLRSCEKNLQAEPTWPSLSCGKCSTIVSSFDFSECNDAQSSSPAQGKPQHSTGAFFCRLGRWGAPLEISDTDLVESRHLVESGMHACSDAHIMISAPQAIVPVRGSVPPRSKQLRAKASHHSLRLQVLQDSPAIPFA